jgi:hypothetical protein
MPTLFRQRNRKITMYAGDHNSPHFHIRTRAGQEAQVSIERLEILAGTDSAAVERAALAWAAAHRNELAARWAQLNE